MHGCLLLVLRSLSLLTEFCLGDGAAYSGLGFLMSITLIQATPSPKTQFRVNSPSLRCSK